MRAAQSISSAPTRTRSALLRVRPAAQHGLDPRHQLARLEGLGQVVVGSELEADDAVHHVAARGEHDDRHAARLADLPADGEAVHARQHHVEDDDVGRLGLEEAQALVGRRGRDGGEAELAEELDEQRRQRLVVVDQEHPVRGWCRHGSL